MPEHEYDAIPTGGVYGEDCLEREFQEPEASTLRELDARAKRHARSYADVMVKAHSKRAAAFAYVEVPKGNEFVTHRKELAEDFVQTIVVKRIREFGVQNSSKEYEERESLPTFWELFQWLLSHEVRDRVLKPALNELAIDYARTRRYQSRAVKAWIRLCFATRSAILVLDCLLSSTWGRLADALRGGHVKKGGGG